MAGAAVTPTQLHRAYESRNRITWPQRKLFPLPAPLADGATALEVAARETLIATALNDCIAIKSVIGELAGDYATDVACTAAETAKTDAETALTAEIDAFNLLGCPHSIGLTWTQCRGRVDRWGVLIVCQVVPECILRHEILCGLEGASPELHVWAIMQSSMCLTIAKCAYGTRREFLRGGNLHMLGLLPQNEEVHSHLVKPLARKWIQALPPGCGMTCLEDFLTHDLKQGEQHWARKAENWGVWSSEPPQH
jgi:hypothetical protein